MIVHHPAASGLALVGLLVAQPAGAGPAPDRPDSLASFTTVVQDLGPGRGTLTTVTLEMQKATPTGIWSLAPAFGRRAQGTASASSVAGAIGWRHAWSNRITTASDAFLAEAHSPFAQASLTQSVAVLVARRTQVTAALRWSRYQGGQDVWFVSGESRRYFRRGSVAYRLTWIKPAGRDGYSSHLLSFTLNDAAGRGRTQLWLSQGQASLTPSQAPDTFRGHDRSVQLRRVQPLGPRLSLSLSGGLATYDLPAGAVRSRNLGLGLSLEF